MSDNSSDGVLYDTFALLFANNENTETFSSAQSIVNIMSARYSKKRSCFGELKKEVYIIYVELINMYSAHRLMRKSLFLIEVACSMIDDESIRRPIATIFIQATKDIQRKFSTSLFKENDVDLLLFISRCLKNDLFVDAKVLLDILKHIATKEYLDIYYQSLLPDVITMVTQLKNDACAKVQHILASEDSQTTSTSDSIVASGGEGGQFSEALVFCVGLITGLKLEGFNLLDLMQKALSAKHWETAELLVDYQKSLGVSLVQGCIDKELYKQAAQYTKLLKLEPMFPDIFLLLKRQSLTKLVKQGKWRLAVTLVGKDSVYRNLLMDILREEMMAEELTSLLEEYHSEGACDIATTVAGVGSEDVKSQSKQNKSKLKQYLKLEVEEENILWIDDLASIQRASPLLLPLCKAPSSSNVSSNNNAGNIFKKKDNGSLSNNSSIHVIGLDVEWKAEIWTTASPSSTESTTSGNENQEEQEESVVSLSSLKASSLKRRKKRKKECLSKPSAALLQLATRTHVFLFDLPAILGTGNSQPTLGKSNDLDMSKNGENTTQKSGNDSLLEDKRLDTIEAFNSLIATLFASKHVVCVGFGFPQDLSVLRSSYAKEVSQSKMPDGEVVNNSEVDSNPSAAATLTSLRTPFSECNSLLEIGDCLRKLDKSKSGLSLTDLCEGWLGLGLDKTEQVSDWCKRPLRQSQRIYAANDAHCLVRIFDVLHEKYGVEIWQKELRHLNQHNESNFKQKLSKAEINNVAAEKESAGQEERGGRTSQEVENQLNILNSKNVIQCGGMVVQADRSSSTPNVDTPEGKRIESSISYNAAGSSTTTVSRSKRMEVYDMKCTAMISASTSIPFIVITPHKSKISLNKLSKHFNEPKKAFKYASNRECKDIFGYPASLMPPIGHRLFYNPVLRQEQVINIVIDSSCFNYKRCTEASVSKDNSYGNDDVSGGGGGGGDSGSSHDLIVDDSLPKTSTMISFAAGDVGKKMVVNNMQELLALHGSSKVADVVSIPISIHSKGQKNSGGGGDNSSKKHYWAMQALNAPSVPSQRDETTTTGSDVLKGNSVFSDEGQNITQRQALAVEDTLTVGEDVGNCFLVDSMLGKVVKRLRAYGFDTLLWNHRLERSSIAEAAARSNRTIITCDAKLAVRKDVKNVVLVKGSSSEEQLNEITRLCNMVVSAAASGEECSNTSEVDSNPQVKRPHVSVSGEIHPFHGGMGIILKRCTNCNSNVGFDTLSKEQVQEILRSSNHNNTQSSVEANSPSGADRRGKEQEKQASNASNGIPEDKLASVKYFFKCKNERCGKLFWDGPKYIL